MNVPLLDLSVLYERHRVEIDGAIARVLASQQFILGPEVDAFEAELGALLGATCIGVSNGSDALVLALTALGVGPGDEVIVPAYTFVATASSVSLVGARPVFADVDPETLNLDPAGVAARLTPRTRAVIPVHLFGLSADLDAIGAALEGRPDVVLIEDAAQALGGRWHDRPLGTIGRIGCFSFFPSKNLGCFGDGGAVVTTDADLADRLRLLRNQGRRRVYHHEIIGFNARLDALQAAILRARLDHLSEWVAERRSNAQRYRELLEAPLRGSGIRLPVADVGPAWHSYNQFNLRVPADRRDALKAWLAERGVGTAVYYPEPLPSQPCFADLPPDAYPASEAASRESLAIPVFPGLTRAQQDYVVACLIAFARGEADGAG